MEEDLERAAERALGEQTGVRGVYLEQLYTFGAPGRDPRGRAITVAYYALAPLARLAVAPGAGEWFRAGELPKLAPDHRAIIAMARRRLSAKLDYSTIAFQFMPAAFTLSELQAVYETIRGEPLDKRNFRRFVQALGRVVETGASRRAGSHRPARLYRLKYPGRVEIIR
jgi:8-oxo-dGTP diphosphatase